MNNLKKSLLAITILFTNIIMAQNIDKQDINIFPKPEQGFHQVIIELPHSDLDKNKKVEIYVGKQMETDNCNSYFVSGSIEKMNLKGWGYDYFTFKTDGNVGSTMIACMDNTKITRFVSAQPYLISYNGKLPIVIYVPDGYEVQYKIYQTNNEVFYGAKSISK